RLGEYLRREGCEVEIITTSQPGEWFERIRARGLGARALTKHRWGSALLHTLRVGRALRRGRFDVILLNHAKFGQRALGLLPDEVIVIPILHNHNDEIYRLA